MQSESSDPKGDVTVFLLKPECLAEARAENACKRRLIQSVDVTPGEICIECHPTPANTKGWCKSESHRCGLKVRLGFHAHYVAPVTGGIRNPNAKVHAR